MPAERCRVGVFLNGCEQFYQRETEQKRDGRWVALPFFVVDRNQAVKMSEAVATALVHRLRGLGADPWIEDAKDGRRIDVPHEGRQQSGEDLRQPVIATLNDIDWYVIKPICRPEGRKWFLSIPVPGLPTNTVVYADDPLSVLRRAGDMNWLQFAKKYQRPEPQPAAPILNGPRRRPGDLR